jgi:3-methyladenine DNA glycosylase/8-oxoguanine DNA glycosylase
MSALRLSPPRDFDLKRDVCSYGYFVLAPNYWDTKTHTLWRAIDIESEPLLLGVRQPKGPGSPLLIQAFGDLSPSRIRKAKLLLTRMLRLDESVEHINRFHTLDPRFKRSGRARLFRSPTLFEDVVKTVTSCNVTWPGTVHMNARLCEVLGNKVSMPKDLRLPDVWTFPSADVLAKTSPAFLRARCRVGYRDQRLIELARLFSLPASKGGIDQDLLQNPGTPDDVLYAALLELPGVGPYAAANIMQLLGRYARLPLDTESVRHGRNVLGMKGSSAQVMKKVKTHFARFEDHAFRSYWFELWAFYEDRHGPAWTWERGSTGKLFTAALLNKPVNPPAATTRPKPAPRAKPRPAKPRKAPASASSKARPANA